MLRLASAEQPTILAGDYNAMHRKGCVAHILGSQVVRTVAARVPQPRIRSLGPRLSDMATGTTMRRFEDAGFKDADPYHQPTIKSRMPIAQIDHVLVSLHFRARRFRVYEHSPVSDHRAISVTLDT